MADPKAIWEKLEQVFKSSRLKRYLRDKASYVLFSKTAYLIP